MSCVQNDCKRYIKYIFRFEWSWCKVLLVPFLSPPVFVLPQEPKTQSVPYWRDSTARLSGHHSGFNGLRDIREESNAVHVGMCVFNHYEGQGQANQQFCTSESTINNFAAKENKKCWTDSVFHLDVVGKHAIDVHAAQNARWDPVQRRVRVSHFPQQAQRKVRVAWGGKMHFLDYWCSGSWLHFQGAKTFMDRRWDHAESSTATAYSVTLFLCPVFLFFLAASFTKNGSGCTDVCS